MRAVDTNVLVRLLVEDDESQRARAAAFIEPGAWVSVLALTEAVWVLRTVYGRQPAELAESLGLLLRHKHLTLQDADVVSAAIHLFRLRPSLGFSDCMILELARKAGHLPLGTFDRALGKADGAQQM